MFEQRTVLPLAFDVFFDMMDADPAGDSDTKNQTFRIEYSRIEPHYFDCRIKQKDGTILNKHGKRN